MKKSYSYRRLQFKVISFGDHKKGRKRAISYSVFSMKHS